MDKIIISILKDQNLGAAIRQMQTFITKNALGEFKDDFMQIVSDYELMKDFVKKGLQDPKREEVYLQLLKRLYGLCNDMTTDLKKKGTAGLTYYSQYAFDYIQTDEIRLFLESFVQDVALLSLENNDTRKQELYSKHHEFLTALFYHILTSAHWDEQTKLFYQDLLLSPTIDSMDAQLIVSAVMLAVLNVFDVNKFMLLLYVYQYATDVNIKQRALVGWILSLPDSETRLFPELETSVKKAITSETVKRDLLELQIQMIYCVSAEEDTEAIQRDIIPQIIKGQNLNWDDEMNSEQLNEILHPDSSEQAMEELENSYMKMMDMQKKGVDIYFGGFSQMKRFPFFNFINNWFAPFYPEHPQLKTIEELKDNNFIQNLFKHSPFCNSDKYSFLLAISSIINRIPQSIREMMAHDNIFIQGADVENKDKPAYIRRMYLQDIYRFFKLCRLNSSFTNPFVQDKFGWKGLFFLNKLIMKSHPEKEMKELGYFLLHRKKYTLLQQLVTDNPFIKKDKDGLYLQACSAFKQAEYERANELYTLLLSMAPEDKNILRGAAQAGFAVNDFARAEECYAILHQMEPDNLLYALNLAISSVRNNHVEEGMQLLFKLDYEHPADPQILRPLAWAELMRAKPEAACMQYDKLLEQSSKALPDDYLNAAYARWFNCDITQAIALFRRYIRLKKASQVNLYTFLTNTFSNDRELIERNGCSTFDVNILIDILGEEKENEV